jgi:hypothetical protein
METAIQFFLKNAHNFNAGPGNFVGTSCRKQPKNVKKCKDISNKGHQSFKIHALELYLFTRECLLLDGQ